MPNAVRAGIIRGVKPVQFFLEDFVAPPAADVTLDLDVQNVLNRPVEGMLRITPPAGIELEAASRKLALKAGQTQRV